jgi:hypothetical protein
MKFISLFFSLFFGYFVCFAQNTTLNLRTKLDDVFSQLDKSQITTGILKEYGYGFVDLTAINPTQPMDLATWRFIYATLYSSRIRGLETLPQLKDTKDKIEGIVRIGNTVLYEGVQYAPVIHYQFNSLRPDAVSTNLLRVSNNRLQDVAGRTQSPYLSHSLFAVACPIKKVEGWLRFKIKEDLFFTNTGKTLSKKEIHFGESGSVFETIQWNTLIEHGFGSSGTKTITLRFTYTDGTVVSSKFEVKVSSPAYQVRYSMTNWYPIDLPAAQGRHSGGQLQIALSINNPTRNTANPRIMKPLIVVEGYDPSGIVPNLTNGEFYDIDDFIDAIPLSFEQQLDDIGSYDLIFLDFRDAVDDIIRNADLLKEAIRRINQEKVPNVNNGNVRENNVVMGLSMGGLVARYALADMEKQDRQGITNNKHETRLLITHDSPHKGANVPLGLQCMISSLASASFNIFNAVSIRISDLIPELNDLQTLAQAPASQQMLIVRGEKTGGGRSDFTFTRNNFLEGEYRTMVSFPNNAPPPYKIVATSNGSECGTNLLNPYSSLVNLNSSIDAIFLPYALYGSANIQAILGVNALPSTGQISRIYAGAFLVNFRILGISISISLYRDDTNNPTGTAPYDTSGGGTYDLARFVGNDLSNNTWGVRYLSLFSLYTRPYIAERFCFIPTPSALDVTDNYGTATLTRAYFGGMLPKRSRFDNIVTVPNIIGSPRFNETHIQFTAYNSRWLFNEMENLNGANITNSAYICTPPQIEHVAGGSSICLGGGSTYRITPALPTNGTIQWTASPAGNVVIESPNSP